jgi:hypothetical protein
MTVFIINCSSAPSYWQTLASLLVDSVHIPEHVSTGSHAKTIINTSQQTMMQVQLPLTIMKIKAIISFWLWGNSLEGQVASSYVMVLAAWITALFDGTLNITANSSILSTWCCNCDLFLQLITNCKNCKILFSYLKTQPGVLCYPTLSMNG